MRFIRKIRYNQDIDLIKHPGHVFWYGLLLLCVVGAPFFLDNYLLGELAQVFIYAIAGAGLMLLVGYTGLVSLGHGAFLALGAYLHGYLFNAGLPLPVSLALAFTITALIGGIISIPALRMTGIYLAVATLAFAVIIEQVLVHWEGITGGLRGMPIPSAEIFGVALNTPQAFYFLCLFLLLCSLWLVLNVLRSPSGRAMLAIRDSETSAESMGINLARTKALAFAISAGLTGIAGGLIAHRLNYLFPDSFGLNTSIQLLLMVVVGGLGSIHGILFGAVFIGLLPQVIAIFRDYAPAQIGQIPGLEPAVFGLILVVFLIYEPLGLYGRWLKIRLFFEEYPLYKKSTYKRQRAFLQTERLK